jgi:formylglycine-generating enzyme required for sulfatase activity
MKALRQFCLGIAVAAATVSQTYAAPLNGTSTNRWTNSLGQIFVPVTGTPVLFCIWDVRVQDYEAFMAATHHDWTKPPFPQTKTHPAVNVSWDDAQAFCNWLTQKERKSGVLGEVVRYRLPTDEEWSLATGLTTEPAGLPSDKSQKTRGVYPWGKGWPPPKGAGNFADVSLSNKKQDSYRIIDGYNDGYPDTSPVGAFAANQFGLYDMGGNVWQWCEDWYDTSKHDRVLRGGSCVCVPRMLLLSWRNHYGQSQMYSYIGFRCVIGGAP